jgi:hypothetical protein
MLTQLFLAARQEGVPPIPFVRSLIRAGLPAAAERLNATRPDLATQFLDLEFERANLSDRFLLSSWGTLSARMRPLLTETVIRSLTGSDFTAGELIRKAYYRVPALAGAGPSCPVPAGPGAPSLTSL